MVSMRSCLMLSLCLSMGLVGSDAALQIKRLDEQAIELRKADFNKAQEKNGVLRKYTKAGLYIVATLALLGGGYAYFKSGHTVQLPIPDLPALTESQEELQKRFTALEKQLKSPKFGSSEWLKATAWNFFVNPIVIMGTIEQAALMGQSFLSKIFYSPTLDWYISEHTNLGKLLNKRDEHGTIHKILAPGTLAEELEHNAAELDGAIASAVPVDLQYHKNRVIANFNHVVDTMAGLIAFLQYKADSSRINIEATERARYLFNYTNNTCISLELALKATEADKKQLLVPIIKGFFAEIEQVLVSFIRIERES